MEKFINPVCSLCMGHCRNCAEDSKIKRDKIRYCRYCGNYIIEKNRVIKRGKTVTFSVGERNVTEWNYDEYGKCIACQKKTQFGSVGTFTQTVWSISNDINYIRLVKKIEFYSNIEQSFVIEKILKSGENIIYFTDLEQMLCDVAPVLLSDDECDSIVANYREAKNFIGKNNLEVVGKDILKTPKGVYLIRCIAGTPCYIAKDDAEKFLKDSDEYKRFCTNIYMNKTH